MFENAVNRTAGRTPVIFGTRRGDGVEPPCLALCGPGVPGLFSHSSHDSCTGESNPLLHLGLNLGNALRELIHSIREVFETSRQLCIRETPDAADLLRHSAFGASRLGTIDSTRTLGRSLVLGMSCRSLATDLREYSKLLQPGFEPGCGHCGLSVECGPSPRSSPYKAFTWRRPRGRTTNSRYSKPRLRLWAGACTTCARRTFSDFLVSNAFATVDKSLCGGFVMMLGA